MSHTDADKKPTTEERVAELKAKLAAGLAALETDDQWKARLRAMMVTGPMSPARYSFRNQVLLAVQADERAQACVPVDLSAVATFEGWKRAGRLVKKGERALWILKPMVGTAKRQLEAARSEAAAKGQTLSSEDEARFTFVRFGLMPVFAVSQTDGEPLQKPVLPEIVEDRGWSSSIEAITQVALDNGVPAITFRNRQISDASGGALGWCNIRTREIVVIDEGRSRAAQFATAVHELAHAILHCKQGFNPHERPAYEIEAESVAFIVSGALNLDTSGFSFGYVKGWAGLQDPIKQVEESGRKISQTACLILDALTGTKRKAEAESEAA